MSILDPDGYRDVWDRYWSTLPAVPQTAFWDCPPPLAAADELPKFQGAFGKERVVVDFGCGNGTQTAFLARHFPRLVGADVSPAAIRKARQTHAARGIDFRALDAMDAAQVAAFSREMGDVNIYMRAVMHQMQREHRPRLAEGLLQLLGKRGVLFMVELSEEAEGYFARISEMSGGPPPGLARVLEHGISPGLMRTSEVAELFPDHDVNTEPALVNTVHTLPDGTRAQVPAFHALVRLRSDPCAPSM